MGSLTHKRISKTSVLVCILAGLLLSVMMVQFRLSGKLNLKRFYDVGPKYTVMYGAYTQSCRFTSIGYEWSYQSTCKSQARISSVCSSSSSIRA